MPPQRTHSQSHKAAAIFALAVLSGCAPYMRYPQLSNPGPAAVQRAEAVVFDPYPLDDVGPDVVGGRPAGYQRPVGEITRGRMFLKSIQRAPQPAPLFPSLTPQGPPLPAGAPLPVGAPLPALPGQPGQAAPFIAPPPQFPASPSAASPSPAMPWSPPTTAVPGMPAGPTAIGAPIPTGQTPFAVPERPAVPPSSRRW